MSFFDKLFWGRGTNNENIKQNQLPTLEEFIKLNSDERMKIIMIIGESGNSHYFPLMKQAISSDTDQGVCFAALKRIHNFKDYPETISFMIDLKKNDFGENYEPYFSMALSRLGIINVEEFKNNINS